jgi:hypothetical protein
MAGGRLIEVNDGHNTQQFFVVDLDDDLQAVEFIKNRPDRIEGEITVRSNLLHSTLDELKRSYGLEQGKAILWIGPLMKRG